MKSFVFKIGLLIIGTFLILQVLPVDRSNPDVDETKDFLLITEAPQEIVSIVKSTLAVLLLRYLLIEYL